MSQARAEADAQQQLATNALINALGDSSSSSSSSSSSGGGAHRLLAALEGDPRTRGVGRAAGRSVQGLQRWWAGVPVSGREVRVCLCVVCVCVGGRRSFHSQDTHRLNLRINGYDGSDVFGNAHSSTH